MVGWDCISRKKGNAKGAKRNVENGIECGGLPWARSHSRKWALAVWPPDFHHHI